MTRSDLEAAARLEHRLRVAARAGRGIDLEQRGDPLGGVAGRHDTDRTVGHLGSLAGGELDVRVVGQDHDLLAGRRRDRGEDLAGARVLGLAAAHDRDVEPLVGDRRRRPARPPGRRRTRRPRSRAALAVRRWRGRGEPPGTGATAPAARVSRTSLAWWSRSEIVALTITPELERLAQDQVRATVVDVDLGCLGIAGDVDRLAGAHEVGADPVEVEELARERVDEVDRLVAVAASRRGRARAEVGRGGMVAPDARAAPAQAPLRREGTTGRLRKGAAGRRRPSRRHRRPAGRAGGSASCRAAREAACVAAAQHGLEVVRRAPRPRRRPRRPRGSRSASFPRPAAGRRRRRRSRPARRACARSRPLKRRFPANPSASPRTTWLRITPELPRAPNSAPSRSRSTTASRLVSCPHVVEHLATRRQPCWSPCRRRAPGRR